MFGLQTELGKFRRTVSKALGKRFDKGTASGRTCLIQYDIVDAPVSDLKAFDVLTADIQNIIHIRIKIFGCLIMCHRFHRTFIQMEGMTHQFFPITCCTAAGHFDAVFALLINLTQMFEHHIKRTSLI